ncbi:MAG: hypothetical protein AAFZ65_12600 [Planctomycetota bacterium]
MTRLKEPRWTFAQLSEALGLSLSETKASVDRALEAGLLGPPLDRSAKPAPVRAALCDFLVHGVRYAFYATPGRVVRGMPTGRSAPPLSELVQAGSAPPLVWPDPEGTVRGQAVEPLYRTAPFVARQDVETYALLALVDGIRCGAKREIELAARELRGRLLDGLGG